MKEELSKYNATAYWWNMGRKKLDFSGNLYQLLVHNGITFKKVTDKKNPHLDCYVFTTLHRVTYRHFGFTFNGAFTALKLHYATMGDKATITIGYVSFTINH